MENAENKMGPIFGNFSRNLSPRDDTQIPRPEIQIKPTSITNIAEDAAMLGITMLEPSMRGLKVLQSQLGPLTELTYTELIEPWMDSEVASTPNTNHQDTISMEGRAVTHSVRVEEHDIHFLVKGVGAKSLVTTGDIYRAVNTIKPEILAQNIATARGDNSFLGVPSISHAKTLFYQSTHLSSKGIELNNGNVRVLGLSSLRDQMLEYAVGLALFKQALLSDELDLNGASLEEVILRGVPIPIECTLLEGMDNYVEWLVDNSELTRRAKSLYKAHEMQFATLGIMVPSNKRLKTLTNDFSAHPDELVEAFETLGTTWRFLLMAGFPHVKNSTHAQNYYSRGLLGYADGTDMSYMNIVADTPESAAIIYRLKILELLVWASAKNSTIPADDLRATFFRKLVGVEDPFWGLGDYSSPSSIKLEKLLKELYDPKKTEEIYLDIGRVLGRYEMSTVIDDLIAQSNKDHRLYQALVDNRANRF